MGAAALYQRDQRRRRTGPRHTGTGALALWPLSLTPIAGIGASLSWMAALPVLDAMQWPFVLTLTILVACGMACAVLSGARKDQWPELDWRPARNS